MKRNIYVTALLMAGLVSATVYPVRAAGTQALAAEANNAVAIAQTAVDDARDSIQGGKDMVTKLKGNPALINEVKKVLVDASKSWAEALKALESAKATAAKVAGAPDLNKAKNLKMMTQVDASVAEANAKVVRTGLYFVEAAAANRTQSLPVIRDAMQDADAAAAQVKFNREQVRNILAGK
ncbi:MAG: hypothetical protein K9M45_08345 [Kiritimatiellales bacterium]|nr:hypothetical protein [Kiritimatiellales bacterium]